MLSGGVLEGDMVTFDVDPGADGLRIVQPEAEPAAV